jgi:imidazolonepropionase-like amidohydrolase
MMTRILSAMPGLLAATFAASVAAQNVVTFPAPAQEGAVVIHNVTVHTISGESIAHGRLRFVDGRIVAVGGEEVSLEGARAIDGEGRHLYPGFVSARTTLGLVEVGAVRATVDLAETGAINPNIRAEVGINPDSELIPVARAGGVLSALVVPQAGQHGVIAGTSALVQLDGWTWDDMTLRAPVAMHLYWPSVQLPPWLPDAVRKQAEEAARAKHKALEEAISDARAYAHAADADALGATDLRWEAMRPLLAGKLPLFVHADDVADILAALDFARKEELRVVLVGAQDAWRVVDRLREQEVAVIASGAHWLPRRRGDAVQTPFELLAVLHRAGVSFALASSGRDSTNERNLPFDAATAVAYGLPREEALKAITLYPAQLLGAGDRLGSLEPGKDATFMLVEGDPLEIRSSIVAAWIGGRQIDLANRQSRLYQKYLEKQRQLGIGE